MKKWWIIVLIVASFALGGFGSYLLCRKYYANIILNENPNYNPDNMPDSMGVKIDSTNFPIIFINTSGKYVEREHYVTANMKIIYNGERMFNYGDTITYPNQAINYEGHIRIKYRGNSSYNLSAKKSYSICAIDENGKKKKSKLLSMRKGKKWALKAVHVDKSMIRDALSYELANSWIKAIPQIRFCEVVIDGVYRGIYVLSEQITADRLKIGKPGNEGDALTGGYLVQIDRRDKNGAYMSKVWSNVGFRYEYPDSDKLTIKQKIYVNRLIDYAESLILKNDYTRCEQVFDIESMIDCLLIVEFSHNADSYSQSTFVYKYPDSKDARLKFGVWDFDLAYGNWAARGRSNTDTWVYNDIRGFWWKEMAKNKEFSKRIRHRWKEYRETTFSDSHIEHVIDSLATLLTKNNAETRNSDAWQIWNGESWLGPKRVMVEKYISVSYKEEIDYLKWWIHESLKWMDKELLQGDVDYFCVPN